MKVCLIPARGGSKRIPRKNIRDFNGKAMIGWSIETAQEAELFERIIVSTDDPEIAEVAKSFGAEVPFMRPTALSDDQTATIPVIRHALDWLESVDALPTALCCLYATAPFARAEDIRAGAAMLETADFAMPVARFGFPIQRAVKLNARARLEMFDPDQYFKRSQDLEEAWHDAGQFYWGRTSAWRSDKLLFGPDTAAIQLPRWRVQDIDTEEDWARAEILARVLDERGEA